jgi:hypothetical protein
MLGEVHGRIVFGKSLSDQNGFVFMEEVYRLQVIFGLHSYLFREILFVLLVTLNWVHLKNIFVLATCCLHHYTVKVQVGHTVAMDTTAQSFD